MPSLRPIAIAISDLHLSLSMPSCRNDKDWLDVQAAYLQQVKDLHKELEMRSEHVEEVFVLCAGDIFDRWNTPPELINFALQHLPNRMLCVPGQHDLPNHRMDQVHRSGYGVLKRAGKIVDLSEMPFTIQSMSVYGFGWGQEITPPRARRKDSPQIALIHKYCWTKSTGYPNAPEEARLGAYAHALKDYDVALFGDNHKDFLREMKSGVQVLNIGGFIRRKSDEISRKPSIGIIYHDGTVEQYPLDTSFDVFHEDAETRKEVPIDMQTFIKGLEDLGEHGLNFVEAVEQYLRKEGVPNETKEIILRATKADDEK